jgi:hypothetical protein
MAATKYEVAVTLPSAEDEGMPQTGVKANSRAKTVFSSRWIQIALAVAAVAAIVLAVVFTTVVDDNGDKAKTKANEVSDLTVRSVPLTCAVNVTDAQFFNVEKIADTDSTLVLNIYNKKAYVLTPEEATGSPTTSVENITSIPEDYTTMYLTTPLRNVTAAETQLIRYLELIGVRGDIISSSQYTTSPCLEKMEDEGLVSVFDGSSLYDFSAPPSNSTSPTFVGYSSAMVAPTTIQSAVSIEQRDGTMLQSAEWIKFFAPFFGKECEANDIFDGIKERYNCHEAKVKQFKQDFDPVNVAVVSKNFGYQCGGCEWETDPYFSFSDAGYWKDYIEDAGGIPLVETSSFDGLTPDPSKGYAFTNVTEFHNLLKEADIVIDSTYLTTNITTQSILDAYNISASEEMDFKFITDKALWRTDRRVSEDGGDDWFEGRYPEADVLLEDLLFAIHPTYSGLIINPKHSLTWLRNMYTAPSQEVLKADMCANTDGAEQLIADTCTSFKTN